MSMGKMTGATYYWPTPFNQPHDPLSRHNGSIPLWILYEAVDTPQMLDQFGNIPLRA